MTDDDVKTWSPARYAPVGVPDSSPEHDACKAEIERREENAKALTERLDAAYALAERAWDYILDADHWHGCNGRLHGSHCDCGRTSILDDLHKFVASRGGGA